MTVDDSEDVGVYLEEGEVKAVNDEPEPQHGGKETPKKRAKKIAASAKP